MAKKQDSCAVNESMLSRIGRKTQLDIPKTGYAMDMTALLAGLDDHGLVSKLSQQLSDHDKAQIISCASYKSDPLWSGREVSRLVAQMANQRKINDFLVDQLKTGHVSAWRSGCLLNCCLELRSLATVKAFTLHVKDLREVDIAKVILFVVTQDRGQDDEECTMLLEILEAVLRRPFRRAYMSEYLKKFGTVQVQEFLSLLIQFLQPSDTEEEAFEAEAKRKLAISWIPLLVDTHLSLLVMQPVFLPLLKRLHELVGEALITTEMLEATLGILNAALASTSKPLPMNPNKIVVMSDYVIERGFEL